MIAEAYRLWYLLCMEEFRQIMPLVEEVGDEGMKKAAEGYYAVSSEWWGDQPTLADYMNGYARRGTLIRMLGEFLERYSTVLLPVSAEQAFEQDADIASVDSMRRVMAAQASMMAIPVLGFPALSVPTGVVDGLPVGVPQLLGRRFDEDGMPGMPGRGHRGSCGHLHPDRSAIARSAGAAATPATPAGRRTRPAGAPAALSSGAAPDRRSRRSPRCPGPRSAVAGSAPSPRGRAAARSRSAAYRARWLSSGSRAGPVPGRPACSWPLRRVRPPACAAGRPRCRRSRGRGTSPVTASRSGCVSRTTLTT